MNTSEAEAYGKYVKYLIELYRAEGMEGLTNFLEYEDEYTASRALSYMVQAYSTLRN